MNSSNLLFLLGHHGLHLLLVKQLWGVLESKWQLLVKHPSVFFDLLGVSILKSTESLGVLLLSLEQILVPLLVELLVLLDVSLLAFLLLLRLVENQFLTFLLIILLFELFQPLLSHFGLHILAFGFTVVSMLVQNLPARRNINGQNIWISDTYMYSWMFSVFGCWYIASLGSDILIRNIS